MPSDGSSLLAPALIKDFIIYKFPVWIAAESGVSLVTWSTKLGSIFLTDSKRKKSTKKIFSSSISIDSKFIFKLSGDSFSSG